MYIFNIGVSVHYLCTQASTWAAVEQQERVDLHQAQLAEVRAQEEAERAANVTKAGEMAEAERTRRMSQPEVVATESKAEPAPAAAPAPAKPAEIRTVSLAHALRSSRLWWGV